MSRDRLPDQLKKIFKAFKGNPSNLPPNNDFILSNEILRDLGKSAPTVTRLKTMRELSEHVLTHRLETNGVEKVWYCIQDMFYKDHSLDERHATFNFLQCLIKGQFSSIGVMRAQFFRFIKEHQNPQDLSQRIELLAVLTHNGKSVQHFDEEIGPFLLNWKDQVNEVGKLHDYLTMIDNIIKFNSSQLDEAILTDFIKYICDLCCNSDQQTTVVLGLQIMSTVVAYSIIPSETLPLFVGTLCGTVNFECYCRESWKTMKNLLGTHLGHSTLFTMCRFLQEPSLKRNANLMRGCVFYIHMALWDINSLQNLCCPPTSVLPSFLLVAKYNHPTVAFEIMLGVQKLINKNGIELLEPSWGVILDIISHIHKQIETSNEEPYKRSFGTLHDSLNTIENLIEVGSYKGSVKHFFNVIHECARDRPEQSVLKLIVYLCNDIRPTERAWLQNLYNLLEHYFRPNVRTNIRLKVIAVVTHIIQLYGQYEDELIDRIVIPHMQNIYSDEDVVIRAEVAKLLTTLCMDYNSTICSDLLDIMEKILLHPYERFTEDNLPTTESDLLDISILIPGLVQVFGRKIHRLPSTHAIKIHKMFVKFLKKHMERPSVFKNFNSSRITILGSFLEMRANALCHLGYPDPYSEQLRFSSYLCVSYKNTDAVFSSTVPSSPPFNQIPVCKVSALCLDECFKLMLNFLEKEKDWEVLKHILDKLPAILANKAIVLAKHNNSDINDMVDILCAMVDPKFILPESPNVKVTRLDLQTAVISVMVCLSSYSSSMDQFRQQLIINKLIRSTGMDPRCSRQTINALTVCMMDMRETMMKLLSDVLLRLSKISATKHIAMPILEFLSTLSQLPTVYGNFVGDQYMAVFAIALPYTNPFKYDNYIVSVAYHVISVWFLKCRLPFRKDFVKFIVSGLKTNVMVPFQELGQFKVNLNTMNQDSSDRKRSSSLTEPSSRRRPKAEGSKKGASFKPVRDATVLTFYEELNETCMDLMARYTYSPCSALPTRLPTAEFLLRGGISKSWMLGNKLITITTSGCTEKVLKHGVCDKCWTLCSSYNDSNTARYSRSNSGNDDKDASLLNRQSSADKAASDDTKVPQTDTLPKVSDERREPPLCACWCQGWAEILIRRPTGNVSWVMKVQNQVSFKQIIQDFPLNEMGTLYMPDLHFNVNPTGSSSEGKEEVGIPDEAVVPIANIAQAVSVPGSPARPTLSRQSSHDSADEEMEFVYDDGTKPRNPVRRSNSSPEMANWKNPFVHQRQESYDETEDDNVKKNKKDVRVSCEAIPEEIAGMGTSPPTGADDLLKAQQVEQQQPPIQHPSLLTCHSYPGSCPPADSNIAPKPYKTVPASPNLVQPISQPAFPSKSNDSVESGSSERAIDRPNNLPNLLNLTPLATKPPQSPTQTSPSMPRHLKDKDGNSIQKSSSSSKLEKSRKSLGTVDPSFAEKRDRLHTISVMSSSSRKPNVDKIRPAKKVPKEILKSGLNPSFVFLQLYYTSALGGTNEVPLFVHSTPQIDNGISMLDMLYPYEVHKFGVLYIGEGQASSEADILNNTFGSVRYMDFLQNLGTLVRLADVNQKSLFIGGMNTNGNDGEYMYVHQDDLVMLSFHVATMMPNKEYDPAGNAKKAHIGNDNVIIVYNNSGETFDIYTFRSQVTLVYIIVEPLDYSCNRVTVKVKSELIKNMPDFARIIGSDESIIVSNQSVSIFVRQLAIHADLTSMVMNSLRTKACDPYVSNWLERLRKLKALRDRVIQEIKKQKEAQMGFSDQTDDVGDFTDFT